MQAAPPYETILRRTNRKKRIPMSNAQLLGSAPLLEKQQGKRKANLEKYDTKKPGWGGGNVKREKQVQKKKGTRNMYLAGKKQRTAKTGEEKNKGLLKPRGRNRGSIVSQRMELTTGVEGCFIRTRAGDERGGNVVNPGTRPQQGSIKYGAGFGKRGH